ncbi:exocyst complex component 8 [Ctenocephalides felis]|uniref:exocyst complex component 8 n=1 Tax=Ctenocephalides felis TaxID=7515 RepID=UPI000E6E188C|nr:exocyst complex component 8 [Ctenocephalides felis]
MNEFIEKFNSHDFNADEYVKELTQKCIGGQELQQEKVKIQALSDETANSLKKNVYQNYMQFIETAKEISHLESEMYQLSHLLGEQKVLLSAIATSSITGKTRDPFSQGDKNDKENEDTISVEEKNKNDIQSVINRVEGLTTELDSVPDRVLLHEGDLLELEPLNHGPLRRVHLFLFNDILLVATWMPSRRGPKRFQFDVIYSIGTLAVVNARDLGPVQNAFKLLVFPDTRVLQCSNPTSKSEWLEKFEKSKKVQHTETNVEETKRPPRKKDLKSIDRSISDEQSSYSTNSLNEIEKPVHPDWVMQSPDELQVLVAQRHFDDALVLLQQTQEYIKTNEQNCPTLGELKTKIENGKASLANVLMSELAVPQGRSLCAALRASRNTVKLLVQLNHASQACDLFLKVSSNALRAGQRQARREGPHAHIGLMSSPVPKLAELFFCDIAEVCREFLKLFANEKSCFSAFVVWTGVELGVFISHLVKHWMSPGTPLQDIAVCVDAVRKPCSQLTELGLDLGYRLEGLLRIPVEKALQDWKTRLCDSAITRNDDRWQPTNLHHKAAVKALIDEMKSYGIDVQSYISGDTWITLSPSTLSFTKQFILIGTACGVLGMPVERRHLSEALLCDMFSAHIKVRPSQSEKVDSGFLSKNRTFLVEKVLPLVTEKFEKSTGFPSPALKALAGPTKSYSTEYL